MTDTSVGGGIGKVPFPVPLSDATELRDDVPFVAELTVLRRGLTTRAGFFSDSEGRCFRVFYRDFWILERTLGRLSVGDKLRGKWRLHRQGRAYGLYALSVWDGRKGPWAKVPKYQKRVVNRPARWKPKVTLP